MSDLDLWPDPILGNTQEPCSICSGMGCPDCREDEQPTGSGDVPAPIVPRAQLAAEAVWWDAVAAQAKARGAQAREVLDVQARAEFTRDRIAPTWRIPDVGTVPFAVTANRVDVVNEAAYTAWVLDRFPEQIETTVRVRPAYDKTVREAATKRGAACTADGELIPGLEFVAGGAPMGISILPRTSYCPIFKPYGPIPEAQLRRCRPDWWQGWSPGARLAQQPSRSCLVTTSPRTVRSPRRWFKISQPS